MLYRIQAIGYNRGVSRPGQYWSYEVLRKKVREFDVEWIDKGGGGKAVWTFVLDRGMEDESGNPIRQELTDEQFFGDGTPDWPVPGTYYAECDAGGEHIGPWKGIHYDKDARAEQHSRSGDEGLRRSIADQFTRLELEIARLRRQLDGADDRESKLKREAQNWVDAIAGKDTEILGLKRERDAALNACEEAELKMEAAVEEKLALQDDLESLREPVRMFATAVVNVGMERMGILGVLPGTEGETNDPPEVQAATMRIVEAVILCPEAAEILRQSVTESGEVLLPQDMEIDGQTVDAIDFLILYLQAIARAAAEAAAEQQQHHTNGSGPTVQETGAVQ